MTAAGSEHVAEVPAFVEDVAEALYALLPAHIRATDEAAGGGVRGLVGVAALAFAEVDAELDRFHDALFVETAPAVALDAIAALVGTPTLQPMPEGASASLRSLIANMLLYRRGKGTARVTEAVAADVSGQGAVAVEYYQRLVKLAHLIDPRPDRPGLGLLIDGDIRARMGSAFDRAPRLAAVAGVTAAKPGYPAGRHALTAVGLHLTRIQTPAFPAPPGATVPAAALAGVPPMRPWMPGGVARTGYFQMADLPEAVLPLFSPDRRSDLQRRRPEASDLPDRLRRLPLHRETAERRRANQASEEPSLPDRPWFRADGSPFTLFVRRQGQTSFARVPPEEVLIVNLTTPPIPAGGRPRAVAPEARAASQTIVAAFDPVTGRAVTAPPVGAQTEIAEIRLTHARGTGRLIGAGAQDRNSPEEPFAIRASAGTFLIRRVDPAQAATGMPSDAERRLPSLAMALDEAGLHGAGKSVLIVIERSGSEDAPMGQTQFRLDLPPATQVTITAAAWQAPQVGRGITPDPILRGYLVRRERIFTLDAPLRLVRGAGGAASDPGGRITLDGLVLNAGLSLGKDAAAQIRLRHVTLRNPGKAVLTSTGSLNDIEIVLDHAIAGRIDLPDGTTARRGKLTIRDSILANDGAAGLLVDAEGFEALFCASTLFGDALVRGINGTNIIVTGALSALRRQGGCLRYSYAGEGSELPRTFQCQPQRAQADAADRLGRALTPGERTLVRLGVAPVFLDQMLGEPALGLLSPMCPDEIRRGGEDDTEMGAHSPIAFGLILENLQRLYAEFLPLAARAGAIDDTRSAALTDRRNRP